MSPLQGLIPLIFVAPLSAAAAIIVFSHVTPKWVPDVVGITTVAFMSVFAGLLAVAAAHHGPMLYRFGAWGAKAGVPLGIAFRVDAASAAAAALIGVLFAAALVFSWGYFDEVDGHYHVLMLLFAAALVGFVLTHDLFNLFVWFEVMSVVAYALTAYKLETPSLAGALNFTVVNSLASFIMLGGVGLMYARGGALDFDALGRAVGQGGRPDPVFAAGFSLLAAALLIKGAQVPFHFWLTDAHAVAPSPVSVIFSGVMVSAALFALAKLLDQVFGGLPEARALAGGLMTVLGGATAVVGALMAFGQRHLKRLLAFSTISHLGVMTLGVAALSPDGLTGFLAYAAGHGLVKGALFMAAGLLLAMRAGVDEIALRGKGRDLPAAGLLMALAGLLLAGLPYGVLESGAGRVYAAIGPAGRVCVFLAAALTGAAVLRAAGRIFLGLGAEPGLEAKAPTQEDAEKRDRPIWLMLTPIAVLIALDLTPAPVYEGFLARAGGEVLARGTAAAGDLVAPAFPGAHALGAGSTLAALAIAALSLLRAREPRAVKGAFDLAFRPVFGVLKPLHTGLVGDYAAWLAAGLALFSAALAFR